MNGLTCFKKMRVRVVSLRSRHFILNPSEEEEEVVPDI
jgi:hypothetical protein